MGERVLGSLMTTATGVGGYSPSSRMKKAISNNSMCLVFLFGGHWPCSVSWYFVPLPKHGALFCAKLTTTNPPTNAGHWDQQPEIICILYNLQCWSVIGCVNHQWFLTWEQDFFGHRIAEFETYMRESGVAEIAKRIMKSNTAVFYHEHVLVSQCVSFSYVISTLRWNRRFPLPDTWRIPCSLNCWYVYGSHALCLGCTSHRRYANSSFCSNLVLEW